MNKLSVPSVFVAALLLISATVAGNGRAIGGDIPSPPAIGSIIEGFTLPDVDGKMHSLDSLKGKKGTVLIFVSVQCPVSNAYNERMEKMAQDYRDRGINVIGINANSSEPGDVVKAHAAEKHLTFQILKDPGNKVADRLGASKTPEAYFLDASNKLLYHGRIDNSRDAGQVSSSELRDAMDALLAGKPVEKTTAAAFGCTIKRA